MTILSEREFNPDGQQDPVHALTLAIRGLKLGGRVKLPNGTLVISQVMNSGTRRERRFVVVPPADSSSPEERHRAGYLGHGAFKSATMAAQKALEGKDED